MSLFNIINDDIKKAMLAKEAGKLEALRAVKSALLLAKTEKAGNEELSEDTELKVLQKLVKQRKESAEIFIQQNRPELAQVEIDQYKTIESYLPKQMSEEELEGVLKGILSALGASGPSDMGKVMGVATKQLAGKADGKLISQKVKELLNK